MLCKLGSWRWFLALRGLFFRSLSAGNRCFRCLICWLILWYLSWCCCWWWDCGLLSSLGWWVSWIPTREKLFLFLVLLFWYCLLSWRGGIRYRWGISTWLVSCTIVKLYYVNYSSRGVLRLFTPTIGGWWWKL